MRDSRDHVGLRRWVYWQISRSLRASTYCMLPAPWSTSYFSGETLGQRHIVVHSFRQPFVVHTRPDHSIQPAQFDTEHTPLHFTPSPTSIDDRHSPWSAPSACLSTTFCVTLSIPKHIRKCILQVPCINRTQPRASSIVICLLDYTIMPFRGCSIRVRLVTIAARCSTPAAGRTET